MGQPHGDGRRRRALAVAALTGCGAVLAGHAVHGVRVTWDLTAGRWAAEATATSHRLSCLERQVDAVIPPGSRVYVDPALGPELWQRSLELVWQRATPVEAGDGADVSLEAVPGSGVDACAGTVVVARPGPARPIVLAAPGRRR
jgi:hypothetical protein